MIGSHVYRFVVTAGVGLGQLILESIFIFIEPVIAFLAWHMILYWGMKNDSSFYFLIYFITFSLQMIIWGWKLIGLNNYDGIWGILFSFTAPQERLLELILVCITIALRGLLIIIGLYLIKLVAVHFRSGGHSISKAKTEATKQAVTMSKDGANPAPIFSSMV